MASEIEPTGDIFERAKRVEDVGLLGLKGYSNTEIAELVGITPATVREYKAQYKAFLERTAEDDPYFLEKVQYNTLKAQAELDQISKETWESVEIATREGMVSARNQALKLALDTATKKAQLNQLLGAAKTDGEYIARMQKAETVNQLISKVVRDVIGECEICREKAVPMLREAFAMMDSEEGVEDPGQAADNIDFADAEVIEEEPDA